MPNEMEVLAPERTTAERPMSKAGRTLVSFREQIELNRPQLQKMLPAHIPLERFVRVVDTAVQQNPKILDATPRSIFSAAMKAATDGLLPDGREGAIVPYNVKKKGEDGKDYWDTDVQWMPMIAGIRKKVRNSGEIATWDAQVVYENDHFDYQLGDNPFINHKPLLSGDRGGVIAAYSIARLKTGELSREVMSIGEIEGIRSRSKAKDSGPWKSDYAEMCRKTVARRHSKVLPMSTDLDDLMRRDDDLYDFNAETAAQPAAPALQNREAPQGLLNKMKALADGQSQPDPAPATSSPSPGKVDEASGEAGTDAGAQQSANKAPAETHDASAPAAPAAAPASEPSTAAKDPTAAAYLAGQEASKAGQKCTPPKELRNADRDAEYDAWVEGWQDHDAGKAG